MIEREILTVQVRIFEPEGVPEPPPIADSAGCVRIIPRAAFAIDSPKVLEPAPGATAALTFTVTIPVAQLIPVSVSYRDSGRGTATAGTDYQPVQPGTLDFPPGTTARTVVVEVLGDADPEPEEIVILELHDPMFGDLDPDATEGVGTILTEPQLFLEGESVTEPPKGERRNMTWRVRLTPPSPRRASVGYRDTLRGTATSGEDYEPIAPGTLTFDAGETLKLITGVVLGDDRYGEPDETIILELVNAMGAAIGDG